MCRDGKISCVFVVGWLGTAALLEQAGATDLLLAKTLRIVGTIRASFHRVILDVALAGFLAAGTDVQQLLGFVKLVDVIRGLVAVFLVPANADVLLRKEDSRNTVDRGVRLARTASTIFTRGSAVTSLSTRLQGSQLGEHLLSPSFVEKGLYPWPVGPLEALVLPAI